MLLDRALQKKYQSGMKFLLYVAVRHLGYEDINYLHSIDKGLYSKIIAPRTLNNEDIEKIKVYIKLQFSCSSFGYCQPFHISLFLDNMYRHHF